MEFTEEVPIGPGVAVRICIQPSPRLEGSKASAIHLTTNAKKTIATVSQEIGAVVSDRGTQSVHVAKQHRPAGSYPTEIELELRTSNGCALRFKNQEATAILQELLNYLLLEYSRIRLRHDCSQLYRRLRRSCVRI